MTTTGTQSKLFGMTCVTLDPRDRTHMLEIADLDAATSSSPLSASRYKQELVKEFMECHGVVGPDRRLAAFAIVRAGELAATITDIVVRTEYRRIGVGKMLVGCIKKRCLAGERKFLEAVVSDANLDAHLFFRRCGFHGEMIREKDRGGEEVHYYLFRTTKKGIPE